MLTIQNLLIAVVIFLIIYIIYKEYKVCQKIKNGVWRASNQYCADAEIDSMILYYDNSNYFGEKTAYLIITGFDTIIFSDTLSFDEHYTFDPYCVTWEFETVEVDELDEEKKSPIIISDLFPNEIYIKIDPIDNKMTIYNDDTIFGILFKDSESLNV